MVPQSISSVRADVDRLSLTFNALADPTRRAILQRLLNGEASVGELAEPFDMSTRAISKHIAVLEAAGLVTRARDAQRRPSRIRAEPLVEVDNWLTLYRCLWIDRFQRLGEVVRQQRGKSRKGKG
jgi:DNA-binding transcriptional ArsR family regulator